MKYIFLNGTDKFVNTNPFGQKLVFAVYLSVGSRLKKAQRCRFYYRRTFFLKKCAAFACKKVKGFWGKGKKL